MQVENCTIIPDSSCFVKDYERFMKEEIKSPARQDPAGDYLKLDSHDFRIDIHAWMQTPHLPPDQFRAAVIVGVSPLTGASS